MTIDPKINQEITSIILGVFEARFPELDTENLEYTDFCKEIAKGEYYDFANALLDIHEILDIPILYGKEENVFEVFPQFADVMGYFYVMYEDVRKTRSLWEILSKTAKSLSDS